MLLNENRAKGPVRKYYDLLVESKVIKKSDKVIIEPHRSITKEVYENDLVLLQQGQVSWDIKNEEFLNSIKYIITCSLIVAQNLEKIKKTFLLEFPLRREYKRNQSFNQREPALYFHGRIIRGKLPIKYLEYVLQSGVKTVLRGPVCYKYWSTEKMDDEEDIKYDNKIKEFQLKYSNLIILPETNDLEIIVKDLNKYKFYFTLSQSEAFNLALQEAIACGTIPLVKRNGAYWWAHELYAGFEKPEELVRLYEKYYDRDLEEYSDAIAEEIQKRCSFDAIYQKFIEQQK